MYYMIMDEMKAKNLEFLNFFPFACAKFEKRSLWKSAHSIDFVCKLDTFSYERKTNKLYVKITRKSGDHNWIGVRYLDMTICGRLLKAKKYHFDQSQLLLRVFWKINEVFRMKIAFFKKKYKT